MSDVTSLIGLTSSLIVGGVLLYAGIAKLRARPRFARTLESFRFVPAAARAQLSFAVPSVELALGVLLVLGLAQTLAAVAAALLLASFTLALAVTFGLRGRADCGCLGSADRTASSGLLIGRNISLAVLSLVAWAAETAAAPGSLVLTVAFGAAFLALAGSFLGVARSEPGVTMAPTPPSQERRRFLKLAASSLGGLVAASSLGLLERHTAEAACFGCGTCGTDYVFLYCVGPCCALYWVRPYNYCETSCPSCSPRTQTYCGIQACC